jgi:hypothetical protein
VVWEIGAGWGGFPYQFKKLFPNVTYVITDFPELFLFSATYLMTAFPDAKVLFVADGTGEADDADWNDYDFVFVPHTALDRTRPSRLDLTVNMVSFQEMTTDQVRAYVEHAHELGSPYLYSLNRDRSHYNPELSNVRDIVSERFWPHEVEVLPVSYVKMLDKMPGAVAGSARVKAAKSKLKAIKSDAKRTLDYKHVIGWRRVEA